MHRVKCRECGKAFSTSNRSVRYCSDPCRKAACARLNKAHKRRPAGSRQDLGGTETVVCLVCGKRFAPDRGPGKPRVLCSDACRVERVRARNREYMARHLADPMNRAILLARNRASAARRAAGKKGGGQPRRRRGARREAGS